MRAFAWYCYARSDAVLHVPAWGSTSSVTLQAGRFPPVRGGG